MGDIPVFMTHVPMAILVESVGPKLVLMAGQTLVLGRLTHFNTVYV